MNHFKMKKPEIKTFDFNGIKYYDLETTAKKLGMYKHDVRGLWDKLGLKVSYGKNYFSCKMVEDYITTK